ncbi:MAG TPA: methyl-accepting chemotaxis protein, partial [Albitalea sp.]|nr:methyl-accepting chemotaxis protein [Albitalea sp.]
MKNLSIKTRLFLLVGMLMMLLLISVASTIVNLRKSNAVLQTVYKDRIVPLRQLMAVAAGFGVNVVDAAHKVRDGAMSADEGLKSLAAARQSIDTHWTAYTATFLEPDEKLLVAKAEPLIKAAHDADRRLEALLVAKDIEGLREFAAKQLYPAIDPVGDIVDQLSKIQLEVAKREYEAGQAEYTRVLWTNASIAALALLAAGVMAWLLIRAVLSGISQAVKVAETVAAGDLSSRIEVDRRDETGQLLGALRRMNDALVLIVGDVRNASDSIATGSTQIATGNADLSQRTEEQASNLQQTAASMEQLTATVKHNADTAREATRLAGDASAVAAHGGEMVGQVVSTMDGISQSSRKIADIIGVIDGIAFQTNILALNAAVEAA